MTVMSKCVEGIEQIVVDDYAMPGQSSLRLGHSKKFYKKRLNKDVKKYSFHDRVMDEWSALPEVVCVCQK